MVPSPPHRDPSDPAGPPDAPAARAFEVHDGLRPRRSALVKEHPLSDDELMLTIGDHQVVHALNPSAWAVWDLCDGSRSVREIAELLAREVPVPLETLLPDVRETVRRLGVLALVDAA